MNRISESARKAIVDLRVKGKSIPEISSDLGIAKTTVQRYVLGIQVPDKHLKALKEKQGGSKSRAIGLRSNVLDEATVLLGNLSKRDEFLLLLGLYWGEGTKKDFGIINSDPYLIQAFIRCLKSMGIKDARLSVSLRLHSDLSQRSAIAFWSQVTGVPKASITRIEIIEGKKKGKLPYGMCRVRVRSGLRERLLIQTAIQLIGKECDKTLVSP